jgi:hypothetical protein
MPREYLTDIDSVRQRPRRDTKERVETTEDVGDPDAGSTQSSSEATAAGGAVLGAALAGPFGAVAGAAVGAVAGATGASADGDQSSDRDRTVREQQNEAREDPDAR